MFVRYAQLRSLQPRTIDSYVGCIVRLTRHYNSDPAKLNEEQVLDYVAMRRDEGLSPSTLNVLLNGLRAFYCHHLKTAADWTIWRDIRIKRQVKLPLVLAREEVALILGCLQRLRFKVALTLIYNCGLRINEALSLTRKDIHSAEQRLHIRGAKGDKERYVPISESMLEKLRVFWRIHRHPVFIFPSPPPGMRSKSGQDLTMLRHAQHPMCATSVQEAFQLALQQSKVQKRATVHTLRHSYATHMLEEGVSIRSIQAYLGHESLETTMIYLHLTALSENKASEAIETLYRQVTGKPRR